MGGRHSAGGPDTAGEGRAGAGNAAGEYGTARRPPEIDAAAPLQENSAAASPDLSRLEIAHLEIAGSELASPEIARPDAACPDIAGPEIAGPEIAGPEIAGLDIAGLEIARPEIAVAGLEITRPEIARPEIARPEIACCDNCSAGAPVEGGDLSVAAAHALRAVRRLNGALTMKRLEQLLLGSRAKDLTTVCDLIRNHTFL